MSLDDRWRQVREFHLAFGHPVSPYPEVLSQSRVQARNRWMLEELQEFVDARTIHDQVDAMVDLIYFSLGTLVELGVEPDQLFQIVHKANMRKLWPDKKPRFDETGKVLKPPEWLGPETEAKSEIDAQIAGKRK